MALNVETATNQVYRRKYFIDSSEIVGRKAGVPPGYSNSKRSKVVKSKQIKLADKPVPLRKGSFADDGEMRIRVVREGNTLKEIYVACPCGRTATLDVACDETQG